MSSESVHVFNVQLVPPALLLVGRSVVLPGEVSALVRVTLVVMVMVVMVVAMPVPS